MATPIVKTDPRRILRGWTAAAAVVLVALPAWGQSGGDFTLVRSTLDGGGGRATGGSFTVQATIAQPDADPLPATGGDYALRGGFWGVGAGVPHGDAIFSDGFESP